MPQIQQKGATGVTSYFDVDLDRLPYVIALSGVERVANRETGETINAFNSDVPLWRADVAVPGCKVAGGVGMAEVSLTIQSHTEPRCDAYQPLRLEGKVLLRGRQDGRGNDRRSFLALRAEGVSAYTGPRRDTALVDVPIEGVPVSLRTDDGDLVVLAASKAKNVYDGRPVTIDGEQVFRLQVTALVDYERHADGVVFQKRESVMVDVVKSVWDRNPVPFLGRIQLEDLRCDARTTNGGGLTMNLGAVGYRIVDAASAGPQRNGRPRRVDPVPVPVAAGSDNPEVGAA